MSLHHLALIALFAIASPALGSEIEFAPGLRFSFVAAAGTAGYGLQPYEAATLSGSVVVDPWVLSLLEPNFTAHHKITAANVTLAEQTDFLYQSCRLADRVTREQVEGRILLTGASRLVGCALGYAADTFFTDAARLGAIGVVTWLPSFGTRFTCAAKFAIDPAVPPGGIAHFCINDIPAAAVSARIFRQIVAASPNTDWGTTPLPVANASLRNDWVPIDELRSDNTYVYFVFLAVWASAIVVFSSFWLVQLLIQGSGALKRSSNLSRADTNFRASTTVVLATILLFEGVIASAVRATRAVMSPLYFGPRIAWFVDTVLPRFLLYFPNIPSSMSTLVVAAEFTRLSLGTTSALGVQLTTRRMHYSILASYAIVPLVLGAVPFIALVLSMFVIGDLSRTNLFARTRSTIISLDQTIDHWESLGELTSLFIGFTMLCAEALFLLSALAVLFQLRVRGSEALRGSAGSLLGHVVVQFAFSIPVIINQFEWNRNDSRTLLMDDNLDTFVFDAVAQGCELVVATAQVLQVSRQMRRMLGLRAKIFVYTEEGSQSRLGSVGSSVGTPQRRAEEGPTALVLVDAAKCKSDYI